MIDKKGPSIDGLFCPQDFVDGENEMVEYVELNPQGARPNEGRERKPINGKKADQNCRWARNPAHRQGHFFCENQVGRIAEMGGEYQEVCGQRKPDAVSFLHSRAPCLRF